MAKKIVIGIVMLVLVGVGVVRVAGKMESTVTVERVFNAPPERVWQLWADAEAMKQWWSPKDYTAPVMQNDLQVGGKFLFSMKSPKGEMFWNTGTYKDVTPAKRIIAHMAFSDENGKVIPGNQVKVPGEWPDEIVMKVDFADMGGKTKVTVTEVGVPLLMKFFAQMGWEQQFDKFEKLL